MIFYYVMPMQGFWCQQPSLKSSKAFHNIVNHSPCVHIYIYGGFPKLGVPFGGPYNKDYSILRSILGYPNFGKLPYMYIHICMCVTPLNEEHPRPSPKSYEPLYIHSFHVILDFLLHAILHYRGHVPKTSEKTLYPIQPYKNHITVFFHLRMPAASR